MNIAIDPGHGGKDSGAVAHDIEEEDFNLIIGSMVTVQLLKAGLGVIQTRVDDTFISLQERCELANSLDCNYFISIHANAAESTKANGIEIFHYPNSKAGKELAVDVLYQITKDFPGVNIRGIKENSFYVLKNTHMPSILIECGFVTNPKDSMFLKNEDSQVKMATSIAQGIVRHIF